MRVCCESRRETGNVVCGLCDGRVLLQVGVAKEEAAARERDLRSLGADKAAVAAEAAAAANRERQAVEARLAATHQVSPMPYCAARPPARLMRHKHAAWLPHVMQPPHVALCHAARPNPNPNAPGLHIQLHSALLFPRLPTNAGDV